MTIPHSIIKYISQEEIRQKFNNSVYSKWIHNGTLKPDLVRDVFIQNPTKIKEPEGTRSQFIRYLDRHGQWVVEIHQYLRPDGTLGGSGKSDPKRLKIGSTIYTV